MDFTNYSTTSSKYKCQLCQQEFVRQTDLKHHSAVCDIMQQTKSERKRSLVRDEETEQDVSRAMPWDQMTAVVRELALKNARLEKKVAGLEKWVNTKKKRINVEEWLTKHVAPDQSWSKYIAAKICMTDDQWDDFATGDTKIFETIQRILQNSLTATSNDEDEDEQNKPIQAFDHKNNEVYVYALTKEKELVWRKMTGDEFCRVLKFIQKKIMEKFIQWKTACDNSIVDSSKQLNKIMCGIAEIPTDNESPMYPKLLHTMYQSVKREFKSVVEFEL